MVDVRHLRVVDAIARNGTVTRAAERLFVTQPAVSHALKEMENRLGVELFRRESRRMVPTREGERLLETARLVLDELDRLEYDLDRYRSGYKGIVRLATGCYTCYHWLPGLLKEFGEAFPDVDVQIVPEVTQAPEAALEDGRLDLAVVQGPVEHPALQAVELFADELRVVVCPTHPLAERTVVSAGDFAGETLLVHTDMEDSAYYREVLAPAGVVPRRVFALQLTEAVLESVRSGLGIAVMAEWVVAPDVAAGRLRALRLGPGGVHRRWYAVTRRRPPPTAAVEELVRLLARDALGAACACAV